MRVYARAAAMVALLVASVSGCDKADSEITDSYKNEIFLPVSVSTSSRTALTPDLTGVRWCVGDEVALWAVGQSDSSKGLSAEKFTLRYFDTSNTIAEFGANIDPMESDQEYTYRSFYPYPSSVSGNNIKYIIPDTQYGEYDGTLDFRVADDATGTALIGEAKHSSARLKFRPLMHVLRITIPEGYNNLVKDISSLVITLPESAAGTMALDMNNTKATPTFAENRTSTIEVNLLGRTINAGDGNYVWVFINPMSGVTGDLLISAVNTDGIRSFDYHIPLVNHSFEAGKITPVNTAIGEAKEITTLTVNIGSNHIGEELTKLNFTAPAGAKFLTDPNDSSSTVDNISVEANDKNQYSVNFITGSCFDTFKKSNLSVSYETKNTLVPVTFSLSGITKNIENNFYGNVPYLLEQNFGKLSKDFSIHDNEGLKFHSDTGYDTTTKLTDYGLTENWTAHRVGGTKGNSLRICCREEAGITYKGWLKAPAMSYIKPGKTVTVTISYNYSGGKTEWSLISGKKGDPTFTVTANSTTYEPGTDGSYTNIKKAHTLNFSATSSTEFTWTVSENKGGGVSQNGNYWLYLDNIKAYIK